MNDWAAAASIPGLGKDNGLHGLVFGYLTSATLVDDGGRVELGPTTQLCAEVELATDHRSRTKA